MVIKQLSLGEVDDLSKLLRKNDMDIFYSKETLKIEIENQKDEDKAYQLLNKVLSYINNYANYDFILEPGKIESHPNENGGLKYIVDITAIRKK